jgi:putative membrane protein
MKVEINNTRRGVRLLGTLLCASTIALAIQAEAGKDDSFIKMAAESGAFEAQAAKLAEQNASNEQVKLLAYKIASYHEQDNKNLQQIASMESVSLPTEPVEKNELNTLSSLKGVDFDKEYVRSMIDFHKSKIAEFMNEAKKGEDIPLKNYASKSVIELQQHLLLAQQVQTQL